MTHAHTRAPSTLGLQTAVEANPQSTYFGAVWAEWWLLTLFLSLLVVLSLCLCGISGAPVSNVFPVAQCDVELRQTGPEVRP